MSKSYFNFFKKSRNDSEELRHPSLTEMSTTPFYSTFEKFPSFKSSKMNSNINSRKYYVNYLMKIDFSNNDLKTLKKFYLLKNLKKGFGRNILKYFNENDIRNEKLKNLYNNNNKIRFGDMIYYDLNVHKRFSNFEEFKLKELKNSQNFTVQKSNIPIKTFYVDKSKEKKNIINLKKKIKKKDSINNILENEKNNNENNVKIKEYNSLNDKNNIEKNKLLLSPISLKTQSNFSISNLEKSYNLLKIKKNSKIRNDLQNNLEILNNKQNKLRNNLFKIIDKSQIKKKPNIDIVLETILNKKIKDKKNKIKNIYFKAVDEREIYKSLNKNKAKFLKVSDIINNMSNEEALKFSEHLMEHYHNKRAKLKLGGKYMPEAIKKKLKLKAIKTRMNAEKNYKSIEKLGYNVNKEKSKLLEEYNKILNDNK